MTIQAPQMTEEDQYGFNMPERYLCNACKAVVWHLNDTFSKKHPSNRQWKEWEIEDMVSNHVCAQETYEGYGVKQHNGENVLNGAGLKEEEQELLGGMASIQMGSETWKKRMSEECRKLLNDQLLDEKTLEQHGTDSVIGAVYDMWQTKKLSKHVCYQNKRYCGNKKHKKEKAKKEKQEAMEKKKMEKEKKKAEKAARKEKKAAQNAAKKLSLETYFKNLARDKGWAPDRFTKPRTEAEWDKSMEEALTSLKSRAQKPAKDEL